MSPCPPACPQPVCRSRQKRGTLRALSSPVGPAGRGPEPGAGAIDAEAAVPAHLRPRAGGPPQGRHRPGQGGLPSAAVHTRCSGSQVPGSGLVLERLSDQPSVSGHILGPWSPVAPARGLRTVPEMADPRLVREGGCFLTGGLDSSSGPKPYTMSP